MTNTTRNASTGGQPTRDDPRPGETCTCGRPATVVFLTGDHGRVPYCGTPDGRPTPEDLNRRT